METPTMKIVVRAVFHENNKYYPQVFLDECLYEIQKLLYYGRIDVNKTSASKECDVCHYRYFLSYSSKLQPNVCNRYHDLPMMSINLRDSAVLNIKGSSYRLLLV